MADEAGAVPPDRGGAITTPEFPPRPSVPAEVTDRAAAWWRKTDETAEQRDVRLQVIADQQALFPYDARRERRNNGPHPGAWTKADARIVQNPLIFRASQRAVAMLVPDGIEYRWKPRRRLSAPSRQGPVPDWQQRESQFAATIQEVVNHHFAEADLQGHIEEWCLYACQFRGGVLKLWYQEEWERSPWNRSRLADDEEKEARAQSLWQSYQNGDFGPDDPPHAEMMEILGSLAEQGPVQIRAGMVAEVVPIERIRVDSHITSPNHLYQAEWMAEILAMTTREIMDMAPFQLDETDPKGFTGVHPDDIGGHTNGGSNSTTSEIVETEASRRGQGYGSSSAHSGRHSFSDGRGGYDYDKLHEVRQVYDRMADRIFILVDGVDYIVDSWRPSYRTTAWYPFHFLSLNPQYGTWYSRSDTELAADAQARVNQADTDDGKLRDLAMSRVVYNRDAVDEDDFTDIAGIPSGGARGVRFREGTLRENMMDLAVQYDPRLGDSFAAQRDFDKMVGFSETLMGSVGNAKFATEVEVAQAGTNLMATQRQKYVQRTLSGVCRYSGEILAQALNEHQVKLIAGPEAYWPPVYSAEQAQEMQQSMMVAAMQIVRLRMNEVAAAEIPAVAATQYPGIENPAIYAQQVYEELAMQTWGSMEPPSREQILRRCRVKVSVSLNADAARLGRYRMLIDLASNMAAMGVRLQPQAAAKILGELLELGDEADDLVMVDPEAAVQSLVQAAQEGKLAGMSPEATQMLAAIGALAQQSTVQDAMQQGAEDAAAAAGTAGAAATPEPHGRSPSQTPGRKPAEGPGHQANGGVAEAQRASEPSEGPIST